MYEHQVVCVGNSVGDLQLVLGEEQGKGWELVAVCESETKGIVSVANHRVAVALNLFFKRKKRKKGRA